MARWIFDLHMVRRTVTPVMARCAAPPRSAPLHGDRLRRPARNISLRQLARAVRAAGGFLVHRHAAELAAARLILRLGREQLGQPPDHESDDDEVDYRAEQVADEELHR